MVGLFVVLEIPIGNFEVVEIANKTVVVGMIVGNMVDKADKITGKVVDKDVDKVVGDYMEVGFHNIFLANLVDKVGLEFAEEAMPTME